MHRSSRRASRNFSKGSRSTNSRKGGKKSNASIVLEEPSKEDRGFAFRSRCSLKSSSRPLTHKTSNVASSINIKISRKSLLSSSKIGSPINRNPSSKQSMSHKMGSSVNKIKEVSPRRRTFTKNSSKSPTRILAASSKSRSPTLLHSSRLGLSPR